MSTAHLPVTTISSFQSEPAKSVKSLASLYATSPVVLTLYLPLDADSRARGRFRIEVKEAVSALHEQIEGLDLPHEEREALNRDLARIEVQAEQGVNLPRSPGLALFACESLNLFQVIPLPMVLTTRLVLDHRPRVAEALEALQGFGRIAVALIDRAHARFFLVTGSATRELSGLVTPVTEGGRYHSDREDSPGWGERAFHNRIREERRRHAAAVTKTLECIVADHRCDWIVLAGPARTVAEQQHFLPSSLSARLIGKLPLNPTATNPADVGENVQLLRAALESANQGTIVKNLEEGWGTGWAVNGVRSTLQALERGQIRTLVLRSGWSAAGFRCGPEQVLVSTLDDCQGKGQAIPVHDLVSEAIEEGLGQGVEVHFVLDPALAAPIEGMAGMLRFR